MIRGEKGASEREREERRRGLKEKGGGVKGFKKSSEKGFLTLLNILGRQTRRQERYWSEVELRC